VSLHVCAYLVSDLVEEESAHRVSSLGPLGLIDVKRKPLADWAPFVKALEDRVLGALLLVALAPVMLVVAIAIKLDSKGPVLFRQRRRGLNQRIIEVRKFRTMRVMEDGAEVRQATRNDPRVTRVGAFLRKTSLDELPQLFNVLEGSMSLVGPRPHALVHDEQWGELLERYANRHQVKPGMTGWAQVNGYRGEVENTEAMGKRVEHDLDYINNWSLGRDLQILARTLRVALGDKKAY
jgi:putative colanic acid biosynthesis UDP-glucose lipid carrier transferase